MKTQHIVIGSVVLVVVVAVGSFFVFREQPEPLQANKAPTASFRATPSESKPRTIEFDAAGSDDPDGNVTDYAWDFGDGQTGTGQSTQHIYERAGEFTVTLTVADHRGASSSVSREVVTHEHLYKLPVPERWDSVGEPATSHPPLFTEIEPADGAVVRGTETWVRWSPSSEAEGRVLWHEAGEAAVRITNATGDGRLTARLQPLELGEKYEYVVEQISGDFVQRSSLRAFSVEGGVVFDPPVVEETVQRDYDQTVTLTLRNNTKESVTVAAKALKHFDDLPADIVGRGSVDDPVEELKPGETINLRLAVFATDATQETYEIPVEAAGVVGTARVHIAKPKFDLDFRIVEEDPCTLAKTIEVINKGQALADLAVRIAPPNEGEVRLDPTVRHAYLGAGQILQVVASPVLYLEFESLNAELECTAAGQSKRLPLQFKAPEGARLIAVRSRSDKRKKGETRSCTNHAPQCDELPGTPDNGWEPRVHVPGVTAPWPKPGGWDDSGQDCKKECNQGAQDIWWMFKDAKDTFEYHTKRQRAYQRYSDEWMYFQKARELNISTMVDACHAWHIWRSLCQAECGGYDIGPLPECADIPEAVPQDPKEALKERLEEDLANLEKEIIDLIALKQDLNDLCGIARPPFVDLPKACNQLWNINYRLAELEKKKVDLELTLRRLGDDPPSPDYLEVVEPVYSRVRTVPVEGEADNLLAELIDVAGWRNACLQAWLVSYERYQGARQAGDRDAARRQAEAMVLYAKRAREADQTASQRQLEFETLMQQWAESVLAIISADTRLTAQVEQSKVKRATPEWVETSGLPDDRVEVYRRHFQALSRKTGKQILQEVRLRVQTRPSRRQLMSLWFLELLSRQMLGTVEAWFAREARVGGDGPVPLIRYLRPGLLNALQRRASFTRIHHGPFAVPVVGNAIESSDYAAAWHAGERVCFAWHSNGDQVVFAAFDPRGETLIVPQAIGKGRWPRVTADGKRTVVAWQSGNGFTVRLHDGEKWGQEIQLSGREAAIAFAPGGPLYAATTTGLWELADGRFEQVQKATYSQPALAVDKDGTPHVAWQRDRQVLYNGTQVGEGERPSILVAPDDTVHLAYLWNGSLTIRSLKEHEWSEHEWSEHEAVPAKNPSWPALALGANNEVRLTYIGAADYGPPALWLVRLPDNEAILVPSLAGNVTDAWFMLKFSLNDARTRYRRHDMLVTVNDVWIKLFENTVPEGRYLFRLNPGQIFYSPRRPVPNRIAIYNWNMNNGNYFLVSDYELIVRTAWSEYFGFASSPEEVIEAAQKTWRINHDQPDLAVLANNLDLPVKAPVGSVDFPITVVNLGEADSRPARLVMLSGEARLSTADIPLLRPGEQMIINMRLNGELEKVTFEIEQDKRDFDPDNDVLDLALWSKEDYAKAYEKARAQNPDLQPLPPDPKAETVFVLNDVQPPWVAGNLPSGAKAIGEWKWHYFPSYRSVPSHSGNETEGPSLHYFIRAQDRLPLAPGDNLVQYVYLDPESPPKQILLQLFVEGRKEGQAVYWGGAEDLIRVGGEDAKRLGDLPEPGQWVRLRVPVETFGMENAWINGLLFGQYSGRAYWGPTSKSISRLDQTEEVMVVFQR